MTPHPAFPAPPARPAPAPRTLSPAPPAPPAPLAPLPPLIDPFGRRVTYLRLSVTDRCDFRCAYCMEERPDFLPKREVLSLEELETLARLFVRLGVTKLRITGGEPLVRRNVMSLFNALGRLLAPASTSSPASSPALQELTLTTNGSQLARLAVPLKRAGVARVNVSLDTLDPARFHQLTRRGHLAPVLDGLAAAKAAGLRVKLNTVAMAGFNESELPDLAAFAGAHGFDISFIEVMPMGELAPGVRLSQYLPLTKVREQLAARFTLSPLERSTGGPSRYWRAAETGRDIGFIAPMTDNFCASCNRVRLSCTGVLYPCLGQETARSLRPILRGGEESAEGQERDPASSAPAPSASSAPSASANDARDPAAAERDLERAIRQTIARKPKGHDFALHLGQEGRGGEAGGLVSRAMHVTGG